MKATLKEFMEKLAGAEEHQRAVTALRAEVESRHPIPAAWPAWLLEEPACPGTQPCGWPHTGPPRGLFSEFAAASSQINI